MSGCALVSGAIEIIECTHIMSLRNKKNSGSIIPKTVNISFFMPQPGFYIILDQIRHS